LTSCNMLLKVVDCLKELLRECVFEFQADGLRVRTMDQTHVALVDFFLKKNVMLTYKLKNNENHDIAVDIHSFHKILQRGHTREQLWLWKRTGEEILRVRFFDTSRGMVEANDEDKKIFTDDRFFHVEKFMGHRFDLGNITVDYKVNAKMMRRGEVDVKYYEIPLVEAEDLGFRKPDNAQRASAEVFITAKMFSHILNDLANFGETLTMKVTDDGIKFVVSSEMGRGSYLLKRALTSNRNEKFVDMKLHDSYIGQAFCVKFLQWFSKAAELCDVVTMELSKDNPFCMTFLLTHKDNGYIRFFIAPKVEED